MQISPPFSCIQSRCFDTGFFCPISNAHSIYSIIHHYITTFISALSGAIRPATIALFVITVAVNSIYGISVWCLSHIIKKIGKIVPAFAYFYSASSIIIIEVCFGIFASIKHSTPNPIRSAMPLPVLKVQTLNYSLFSEAST